MSNLSAFLHPEVAPEKEVIISNRFKDADGTIVPFRIKPLTQEESDRLTKKCRIVTKDRTGRDTSKLDTTKFSNALIVAATVEPDFSSKEICDAYGVVDPLLVPGKMLYAGEFQKLASAIMELSGLGENAEEEAVEEAKNL